MKISVIIPVYNAEKYISKAVYSALDFDCVDEIILVEDKSPDNAYAICLELEKQFSKVKVYCHPSHTNLGAGASRNLGILKAKNEWIAFLDADDFYLPNRFTKELEFFSSKIGFDGIYGALDIHYYSEKAKAVFTKKFNNIKLTTVSEFVEAAELKYVLMGMSKIKKGYFHLNTLTVKKELLLKVGLYNTQLRLHQDTDLIVKLSCKGNLISGEIKTPISSRGVHEDNRITSSSSNFDSRFLMYRELQNWMSKNTSDKKIHYKIAQDVKCYHFLSKHKRYSIANAIFYTINNAGLFYNDKYFNLIVNNSNCAAKRKKFVIRVKEKFVLLFLGNQKKKYSIYIYE